MSENKIYNIKKSSLGKIQFGDGTVFIGYEFKIHDNVFKAKKIYPETTTGVNNFPNVFFDNIDKHLTEEEHAKIRKEIVEWLINEWLNPGVMTLKSALENDYHMKDEWRDLPPKAWLEQDRNLILLTMCHIALRFTNGYIATPGGDLKIYCKFVKNLVGINFWDLDKNAQNTAK